MQTSRKAKGQGNLLMHEEIELELLLWCLVQNNCCCWHVSSRARACPMGSLWWGPVLAPRYFNLEGSCPTSVRGNGNRKEAADGHCLLLSKFLIPVLS